jgi:phosphoribosylformylglycinamidine cyclo-ligase
MKNKKITYAQAGVNYKELDPIKKMAQDAGRATAANLKYSGYEEVFSSRGESAYVWKQGGIYMASVVEGLGTKNLVADEMRKITGRTYYEIIAHDTVATIINDLITVGATPLVLHAYWAVGSGEFLTDTQRMRDFISGWKRACDIAGVSWGGGETPTLKGIVVPDTIDLGGSAVGIIKKKKYLLTDNKLKKGDRILLIKSNGINANGLSLARAVAKGFKKGYATQIPRGQMYGEAVLQKSNIYARLVQDLQKDNVTIHYISNITGHGLRKLMRARHDYTYVIEKIFDPQELFLFIQSQAHLSDFEMYQTYNMGMDYALFIPENEVKMAQKIIKKNGFESLDAGYVESGKKQVIIEPKKVTYAGDSLDLR